MYSMSAESARSARPNGLLLCSKNPVMAWAMLSNIRSGSKVAVVAPASPVAVDAYQAGLGILATRYTIVHAYDPQSLSAAPFPYLAAEDQCRADFFNQALRDLQVEAIFCARGGYGVMRILGLLDSEVLRQRQIPIVGFSDITALHAWAACHGVASVHGPVVTQLGHLPPPEVQSLFDLLEGQAAPHFSGLETVRRGFATGPVWGGNLTIISHLCGTPYLPNLSGRILLLEEIAEPPYRIDRMLTQLMMAGVFQQTAGIVIGDLLRCDGPQGPHQLFTRGRAVMAERLGHLGIPVVMGAPVGHGEHNLALPLGVPAHLDGDAGTLWFEIGEA